jgi:hypothetical protein
MATQTEIERRQALIELMARPDEAPLRRGHRLVLEGRPDRHQQCARLAAAYVQATLLRWQESREATVRPFAGVAHSDLFSCAPGVRSLGATEGRTVAS